MITNTFIFAISLICSGITLCGWFVFTCCLNVEYLFIHLLSIWYPFFLLGCFLKDLLEFFVYSGYESFNFSSYQWQLLMILHFIAVHFHQSFLWLILFVFCLRDLSIPQGHGGIFMFPLGASLFYMLHFSCMICLELIFMNGVRCGIWGTNSSTK